MHYSYTCEAAACRITVEGLSYRRRRCHRCGTRITLKPLAVDTAAAALVLLRAPFVRELAENGRYRATRRAAYAWLASYRMARTWGRVGDRRARQAAVADWDHYAPASTNQVLVDALVCPPRRRPTILARLLMRERRAPPSIEHTAAMAEVERILAS